MTVRWPMVPLGEVLTRHDDWIAIDPETRYRQVTARLWGQGLTLRGVVLGAEIAATSQNRIRQGQFLISKIDARHGAFGLVPEDLDGAIVSNDFPAFDVNPARALPAFVRWVSKTDWFVALCKRASEGSTNRVRLREGAFLAQEIPAPPLEVQRRIVARLDAVEARIGQIKRLHSEIGSDLSDFVTSANAHFGTEPTKLGDALVLDEDRVAIAAGESYPQVGIRGFGGGLFPKPPVEAGATTYRHFNRLHAGHFVMSQVKGWEGAVAVCNATFEGMYASPEYRTFRCEPDRLRPTYLSHLCATPWFHDQLALLTRGQGARRERLRPELLLDLLIPLPDVEAQTRLELSFDRLLRIRHGHEGDDLDHVLPALLAEAFGSG